MVLTPYGSSMATPVTLGFAKLAQAWSELGPPVALGWRSLAEADSEPIHDRWARPPHGSALYFLALQLVGDGGAVGLKSQKSPSPNDRYARSHGKMTFPAATSRRLKVRCLFTGSSMTAQSRRSSTSLPPLMAQSRPALPRCIRG